MVQAGRHFLIGFLFFNVLSCVAPRVVSPSCVGRQWVRVVLVGLTSRLVRLRT
jgi:hypothetical protein